MLLPIAGAYLLGKKGRHPVRWLGAFAVLVAFASVELSGSRGGMISLLIEIAIFGIVFGRSRLFGKRRAAAMSAIAVFAVVAAFLWIAPPEVLARYQTLVKSPDLTLGIRKQMTMDALQIFREYRWLGAGLGSHETVSPRYQSVLPERVVDHAHNDFAELMAETGIAGLVLAMVAIEIFFVAAFRKLKSKFDDLGGCIRLGAAVGCCGVLVHSFSDFNLHIPANAAWFVACAAISQLPVPASLNQNPARFANTNS
jgi:O-antigen ligase